MLEVQKELQALRMKAAAIANDKTKDEKLQQLEADRLQCRNEALRLDTLTGSLREKLIVHRNKVLEAGNDNCNGV